LSTLDLRAKPRKIQKYHFLSTGLQEYPKRHGTTCLGTGALEVPSLAKMTKMPLVNPRLDRRSNKVETLKKELFSYFYNKPELLEEF